MIKTETYLFAWKAILMAVQFLPGALFCYGVFRPERKYSSYLLFPMLLLILALGIPGIAWIQFLTAPTVPQIVLNPPTLGAYILLVLMMCALFILSVSMRPQDVLFLFLNSEAYFLFLAMLHHAFSPFVPHRTLFTSTVYYLTIYTMTYPALVALYQRLLMPTLLSGVQSVRRKLFLAPAVLIFFFVLLRLQNTPPTPRGGVIVVLLTVSLFAAYLCLLFSILKMSQALFSGQEFLLRMRQTEECYLALTENIRQARVHRHDFRHHMTLIRQMNRDGQTQEIESYLSDYLEATTPDTVAHYTNNYYIDALMYHFFREAQREGIHTIAQINLPSELRIAPYDLCGIFGNCLENALEACRNQREGYRFIRVQGELIQGKIILIFSNSFNGFIRAQEHLLSTKSGGNHGFGVHSVEYAASRYGGQVKIDYTSQLFRISVVLNQPRADEPGL